MKRIVYLTFNDKPGGIYTSQVIDTCRFLQKNLKQEVLLIAFISIRNIFEQRRLIREKLNTAKVFPMYPGIQNWKSNVNRLRRALRHYRADEVIARGPFATLLAKKAEAKRLIFDARGAYAAEFSEYNLSGGKFSNEEISDLEKNALNASDFQLAVSRKLVGYWKQRYDFESRRYAVVPCTVGEHFRDPVQFPEPHDGIRLVFSAGGGNWQSLRLLSRMLEPLFVQNEKATLTILSKEQSGDFALAQKFPSRVTFDWIAEKKMPEYLAAFDYGCLLREDTVTNAVASPVKFAEYLAAGLQVIVTSNVGDFPAFVEQQGCGVVADQPIQSLLPVTAHDRQRNRQLAMDYFLRERYIAAYKTGLECE